MDISVKEMTVTNGERIIFGKLYAPVKRGKRPAVILSHGYNGTNTDWVKECCYYASKGYIAYAFDFCGGSKKSGSSGESTDMTISSEKEDLLAVIDHISSLKNVDSKRTALLGGSQGGLVSALAAAERKDTICALALYFPALCIHDDWSKKYKNASDAPVMFDFMGLKLGRSFVKDALDLDIFGTIGDFKGKVLMLHGDRDGIVPYSYSKRAADIYENATLIKMKNEGHGFSRENDDLAMDIVLRFLDTNSKRRKRS